MTALKLLAIETSSSTGSLALAVGDDVADKTIATPREQTPRMLAIIDELLGTAGYKVADLDAVIFGRGPGSFTGLRVAAAVAQGLSFATSVPIVSVSSLAALAQTAIDSADVSDHHLLCCVDARMGEVYWAGYRSSDGLATLESEERLGPPNSVTAPADPFIGLGDGFAAYADTLGAVQVRAQSVDPVATPSARALLTLGRPEVEAGRFLAIEAALPVYLRTAEAWRKS